MIGVLLLVAIANRFRIKKLDWLEQFIMMYGGLRGGVAFALVLTITKEVAPNAKMFVTTTLAMVYFTVFVQGITIGPLVRYLKVRTRKSAEPSMAVRVTERLMDQAKTGIEDILGDNSEVPLRVRNWYKRVADKYLKPLLLRPEARANDKMLDTFEVPDSGRHAVGEGQEPDGAGYHGEQGGWEGTHQPCLCRGDINSKA